MGAIRRGKVIKRAILIAIVLGVVWAGATGKFDWRRMLGIGRTYAGNAVQAVGVPAGGLSNYGNAAPNNPECAGKCRTMLARIHSAKLALRSKSGVEVRDSSWDAVLKEMGERSIPNCPCGGKYILNTMQDLPTCSFGANGTTDTADDHAIKM